MDVLLGFMNTFNDLLRESGIGVKEFGRRIGTLPSVVSEWKNKTVDVRAKSLIKIADYFHCSLEYLCGKDSVYLNYKPKTCPAFGERIVTVLKECNYSSYRLFKETQISPAQYHHWRMGMEPLLSSMEIIAEKLGITLDYLIGRDS